MRQCIHYIYEILSTIKRIKVTSLCHFVSTLLPLSTLNSNTLHSAVVAKAQSRKMYLSKPVSVRRLKPYFTLHRFAFQANTLPTPRRACCPLHACHTPPCRWHTTPSVIGDVGWHKVDDGRNMRQWRDVFFCLLSFVAFPLESPGFIDTTFIWA